MNETDKLLERLKRQPMPAIDNPDQLTDSIMNSLPAQDMAKASGWHWRYALMAVAASIALLLLLMYPFGDDEAEDRPVAVERLRPKQQARSQTAKQTPVAPQAEQIEVGQMAESQTAVARSATRRRKSVGQSAAGQPVKEAAATADTAILPVEPMLATTIANPAEDVERKFRKQAEDIRQRGELVIQRVVMLNQETEDEKPYHIIEL